EEAASQPRILERTVRQGMMIALDHVVEANRGADVLGYGKANRIGTFGGGESLAVAAGITEVAHQGEPVVIRLPRLVGDCAAYAGPYVPQREHGVSGSACASQLGGPEIRARHFRRYSSTRHEYHSSGDVIEPGGAEPGRQFYALRTGDGVS